MLKIWPFPLLRNYSENKDLTELFLAFVQCEELKVVNVDETETTVQSSFGTLTFWSANKFYAWGFAGVFTDKTGKKHSWRYCMPSRYAVRLMSKKLEKYNRFFFKLENKQ